MTTAEEQVTTRYSFGGDEWILVELAEGMSVGVNMRGLAICRRLEALALDGVIDICPANASYLVRLDPDTIHPRALQERLRELEAEVGDAADFHLQTRIVDVPILWDDPWTRETVKRFADRHQTPDLTNIEFAAQINGFPTTDAFRDAVFGTPFLATMLGFVPGLVWGYQLVPQDRQIEVPKYVRPRTDTPERAFSWGGAFTAVYPVRGAGGYQLLGMCATPFFDSRRRLPDFTDMDWFFRAGDIMRYREVDRSEFDRIRATVEDETFRYRFAEVEFVPGRWYDDPDGIASGLERSLDDA
jgi:urea carboxylase